MDSIIGPVPGYTVDFYDDGVITYKAPREMREVFKRLTDDLGIETKRVKRKVDAEILCSWGARNFACNEYREDVTRRGNNQGRIELIKRQNRKQQRIIKHVGYALGLVTPVETHEDWRRTDTAMAVSPNYQGNWYSELDQSALVSLYG